MLDFVTCIQRFVFNLHFLSFFIGFSLITSCTRTVEKIREIEVLRDPIQESPPTTISVNESMDADSLVEFGEQLFASDTFMLAKKSFDWALKKNPNNLKAEFYSKFLDRFMVFEGIIPRIRPLFKNGDSGKSWNTFIETLPSGPFKKFLLAPGKPPISTYREFQDLVHLYVDKMIAMRDFLIKNSNLELTLQLRRDVLENLFGNSKLSPCQVIHEDSGEFKVRCNYQDFGKLRITPVDAIALRQYLAGEIFFMSIYYTSYDVAGLEKLLQKDPKGEWSERQKLGFLVHSVPEFGRLRKDHHMGILASLGSDFIAAARWAINNQNSLCPQTRYGERRAGYLFSNGICLDGDRSESQKSLDFFAKALSEPFLMLDFPTDTERSKNSGNSAPPAQQVKVSFQPLFSKPVEDLRRLMAKTDNPCGHPISWLDPTFGGFLPDGDVERVIKKEINCD